MDFQGFNKISINCDIMIHIYKMLNFETQLRLAQVDDDLRSIFENFVWTVDYRALTVSESFPDYLLTNEGNVRRILLTADVFREFLRFYAEQVQDLTSYSHLDMRQFKNLTTLRCCADICWLELIQSVAANVPNLETLHLLSYRRDPKSYFSHYMRTYLIGALEDNHLTAEFVESLLHMSRLKRLSLDYRDDHPIIKIKYPHFCGLVFRMQLEMLKLSFVLEPGESAIETCYSASTSVAKLKKLCITTTFDPRKWSRNYGTFLRFFENLTSLNARMTDGVTDEILLIITDNCRNLQNLTIQRTTFSDIKLFSIPPTVNELCIEFCYGLSYHNLREILMENTIAKFISKGTCYRGVFADFHLSPSIQTLDVDDINMQDFPSAYVQNENLRNLTWYPAKDSRNSPNKVSGVALETCLNLETLVMKHSQMSLAPLLQLKHLHKLTMCLFGAIEWSFISALLRHSPLDQLAIRIEETQTDAPVKGFPTPLSYVKVFYQKPFGTDLDFWLDLFCHNAHMKLAISAYPYPEDSLRRLMAYKNFPARLRTITFFGFTLNCDDLRRNFDEAVKNVRYDINEFDNPEDEMYFIVLCRR